MEHPAAGPNYVCEWVESSGISVYTKSGGFVATIPQNQLYGAGGGGNGHIFYDELAQRWVASNICGDGAIIGISNNNDPTAGWTACPAFSVWGWLPDGAPMGYNADAYFIWGGAGGGVAIIAKNSMLNQNSANFVYGECFGGGDGIALEPDSAPGDPEWMFAGSQPAAGTLYKITNVLTNPVVTSYTVALSGGTGNESGQVIVRNHLLAETSLLNGGTNGLQWAIINVGGSTPVVVQNGILTPPTGCTFKDPSCAISKDGSFGLTYLLNNTTNSSLTIYVTGRASSDPANTLQTPAAVVSGPYTSGPTSDYSGVCADVAADGSPMNSFWAAGTRYTSSGYGTQLVSFAPTPTTVVALKGLGASGSVSLSWAANIGATTYNVGRATSSGGPYTTIGTPAGASYTDTSVTNGTTYYYVVSENTLGGVSANSAQVSVKAGTIAPAAPTGLAATPGNKQVALHWNASTGATSYNVLRSTSSTGAYLSVGTASGASYTDATAQNFVTYYYVVTAVNAGGSSANSSQISAQPAGPPAAPLVTANATGPASVNLLWSDIWGATSYTVQRATASGGPYNTAVEYDGSFAQQAATLGSCSFTDTNLVAGTTYYYVVSAVNANGQTSSAQVSVATLPSPWLAADVGLTQPGSTSYSGSVWTLTGTGKRIGGSNDTFHYVYYPVTGDCTLTARVASQAAGSNTDVGVMVRDSLASTAASACVYTQPSLNKFQFTYRPTIGASSTTATVSPLNASPNNWVRITRTGNSFSAYESANGSSWTQIGSTQTFAMASTYYVGLAVCANSTGPTVATVDNVSISTATPVNFVLPTLQLRLPLTDPTGSTSTASDTSGGGLSLTMNMLGANGTAADLHGAAGTGVTNVNASARALDLTSATQSSQGTSQPGNNAGPGPILQALGSSALATLGPEGDGNVSTCVISFWMKQPYQYSSTTGIHPRLFILNAGSAGADEVSHSFQMEEESANQLWFQFGQWGMATEPLPFSFPTNQWMFVAEAYDGTTVSIWYGTDTQPASMIASAALPAQAINLASSGGVASLAIGNRATDHSRSFNGWISDFRIYTGDLAGLPMANFVESIRGSTEGTYQFDASSLLVTAATNAVDVDTNSGYLNPSGNANILRATAVGNQITYLLPNIPAGVYNVSVGTKETSARGQFQLAASRADQSSWANIGSVMDEYNSGTVFTSLNLGSWNPGTTNSKIFRFTVTGKNASSSSYLLDIASIQLQLQP